MMSFAQVHGLLTLWTLQTLQTGGVSKHTFTILISCGALSG